MQDSETKEPRYLSDGYTVEGFELPVSISCFTLTAAFVYQDGRWKSDRPFIRQHVDLFSTFSDYFLEYDIPSYCVPVERKLR